MCVVIVQYLRYVQYHYLTLYISLWRSTRMVSENKIIFAFYFVRKLIFFPSFQRSALFLENMCVISSTYWTFRETFTHIMDVAGRYIEQIWLCADNTDKTITEMSKMTHAPAERRCVDAMTNPMICLPTDFFGPLKVKEKKKQNLLNLSETSLECKHSAGLRLRFVRHQTDH